MDAKIADLSLQVLDLERLLRRRRHLSEQSEDGGDDVDH
jgi:hypothetical protein